jgi:hypothetical protein
MTGSILLDIRRGDSGCIAKVNQLVSSIGFRRFTE